MPFKEIVPGRPWAVQTTEPGALKRLKEWRSNPENMIELFRPKMPGDTVHHKEDTDVEGYSKGGKIKRKSIPAGHRSWRR